jgi:hypothetical protein
MKENKKNKDQNKKKTIHQQLGLKDELKTIIFFIKRSRKEIMNKKIIVFLIYI